MKHASPPPARLLFCMVSVALAACAAVMALTVTLGRLLVEALTDWRVRRVEYLTTLPGPVVGEVLQKLKTLLY